MITSLSIVGPLMTFGVGGRGGGAGLGARFSLSTIRMRSRTSGEGERVRAGTKRILSAGPRLDSLTTRRKCTSSSTLLDGGLTLRVRSTRRVTRTGLGDLARGRSMVSISLCRSTICPEPARLLSSRIQAGWRSLVRSRKRTSTSSNSRTGARRGASLTYSRSSNSTRLLDMAAFWSARALFCFCGLWVCLWLADDQAGLAWCGAVSCSKWWRADGGVVVRRGGELDNCQQKGGRQV